MKINSELKKELCGNPFGIFWFLYPHGLMITCQIITNLVHLYLPLIRQRGKLGLEQCDNLCLDSTLRSSNPMITILLLVLSNIFMTFAWYRHLKYGHDWPLLKAILVSWTIAFLEYCPGGAGKSSWLRPVLWFPAQNYSRNRYVDRFHCFRDNIYERENSMELSRGVRLSLSGHVFCICF